MTYKRSFAALAALALAACSGPGTNPSANVPAMSALGTGSSQFVRMRAKSNPIQHVVFIIQENRSFNNLFMGFPGAETQNYGYDTNGKKIVLHAENLKTSWDIDHSSYGFFEACDGQGSLPGTQCKMDGWNREQAGTGHPANFAYAYVTRSQIAPYWAMAKEYVLADHMYPSNLDGSFVAHQYAIAAYASSAVDYPEGEWGCGEQNVKVSTLTQQRTYGSAISDCFTNPTIASEADSAGITWRFYAGPAQGDGGLWSAYQADKNVYGTKEWTTNVISPPSTFLTDIGSGVLANITWITPTYEASDHAGLSNGSGPAWVTSVVNAIGTSKYWNSTAIFIIWDDPGGWFDEMQPVLADYDGLGFRIPMIVISPYAKKHYVTNVQYETAGVLRFMEDTFGLGHLAASDARATDPGIDVLDLSQKPRKFKPFAGSKPDAYWIRQERASKLHGVPKSIIGDD